MNTKYSAYPVTGKVAQNFLEAHPECIDRWNLTDMPKEEADAERVYQHTVVQALYGRSKKISRADALARINAGESVEEIISSLKID